MAFRFFTVPIHHGSQAEAELNTFLNTHKILNVDRKWVEQGEQSFWSFCADYLPANSGGKTPDYARSGTRERVDYREKLTAEQFEVYLKLRDLRKEISQKEAVPVYMVFTNEQLAQMVANHVSSKADLEKIFGVGEAKVEKYGPRFLELLATLWGAPHETNGTTV